MNEPDYTGIAQHRHDALVQSFAQTWREVFDSPRAAQIMNAGAVDWWYESSGIARWEGEGGR